MLANGKLYKLITLVVAACITMTYCSNNFSLCAPSIFDKSVVTSTEFCCCDLPHEIQLVGYSAINHSSKIGKIYAMTYMYCNCNLSLMCQMRNYLKNLGEHYFPHIITLELSYIDSKMAEGNMSVK